MECSFCDKDAILIAGKNYCDSHIGFFDVRFFTHAVIRMFDSQHEIDKFFVWAFGNIYPKLSDLCEWHGRVLREENEPDKWKSEGIYKEGQDNYIRKIAQKYLSTRKEEMSHGIVERRLT